jgi:hypothetical protein
LAIDGSFVAANSPDADSSEDSVSDSSSSVNDEDVLAGAFASGADSFPCMESASASGVKSVCSSDGLLVTFS